MFRFENRAGEKLIVTTEKIWVNRPFNSRVENWRGPPPGTTRLSLRQSALGELASIGSGGGTPLNIAAPPSLATGDLRMDLILEDAVKDKVMLRRERREVFGRECQVYRAGNSVLAGDLERYEPGRGDYADACVDRNGIIVEEYWVKNDKLIRRRVVTQLEVDRPIDKDLFDIEVPENPDINPGIVKRVPDSVTREGLWTLPKGPNGFRSIGRYGVVLSEAAVPQSSGGLPTPPPASTSDVYTRGPDVLVVDQDPSLATIAKADKRPSSDVTVGDLGKGKLIVDARMCEIRAQTPDGSYVRVFGTVEPDELIGVARSLRRDEG